MAASSLGDIRHVAHMRPPIPMTSTTAMLARSPLALGVGRARRCSGHSRSQSRAPDARGPAGPAGGGAAVPALRIMGIPAAQRLPENHGRYRYGGVHNTLRDRSIPRERIDGPAPLERQIMADSYGHQPRGPARLLAATRWSMQGLRAAWLHESSFRTEVLLFVMLCPVGWMLGAGPVERVLLIGSLLAVLALELLNSSVEAVIERFGPEWHPLTGRAKDMGSAAVFVGLAGAALTWTSLVIVPMARPLTTP